MLFQRWVFFLVLSLAPVLSQANSSAIKSEAFEFSLPSNWQVLNKNESNGFSTVNFQNEKSDVIQFSVSGELSPVKFKNAKKSLQLGLGKDKSSDGWIVKKYGVVVIPSLGDVDEEITVATTGDLTSATYTVYGNGRIALFTFTLNGNEPNIERIVRPLVSAFKWK